MRMEKILFAIVGFLVVVGVVLAVRRWTALRKLATRMNAWVDAV